LIRFYGASRKQKNSSAPRLAQQLAGNGKPVPGHSLWR